MTMNPGRGNEGGETVQKLQSREAECRASGWIRPRQNVEHLVGTPTDEVEATQGERQPGTVANEAFAAGAV
jgi:hypothetical protein